MGEPFNRDGEPTRANAHEDDRAYAPRAAGRRTGGADEGEPQLKRGKQAHHDKKGAYRH